MKAPRFLQGLVRVLVTYRLVLSIGVAAASSFVLHSVWPWEGDGSLMRLFAAERPGIYALISHGYDIFLFTTPFLLSSMLFSLLYVHVFRRETEQVIGVLRPYPDPRTRLELGLVVGEVHQQLSPEPSPNPYWLEIPENGLYTGIAVIGSIGSGKTQGLILPAMRQLFAYRADDPNRKLSGIVLEVKGDLCRQLKNILA